MSNFAFLPSQFKTIAESASKAESQVHGDPRTPLLGPYWPDCVTFDLHQTDLLNDKAGCR
jgi:hypothetical protein